MTTALYESHAGADEVQGVWAELGDLMTAKAFELVRNLLVIVSGSAIPGMCTK